MFDLLCRAHGIEHRLTKPNHPWTNGQVERMNRTLKEATVRRYHYDSHHQLRQHIQTFIDAYNFAKRLKTLNGLTPFESVCKAWTKEPNRFKYDPVHLTSGLHTYPPPESTSDLADFYQRQGHAPRFAGKGREIGPALRSDRTLPKPTCVARCLRSGAPPLRVT